jgi:hypothetical protein
MLSEQSIWFALYARLQKRKDGHGHLTGGRAILVQLSCRVHPLHPPSVRLHWIKRLEDRWIGPSHPSIHEWCGNTTARMHARAACQRSPARALDQMLHNSDRPWTHVNNVPRHDARAGSPSEPGSSSRRCWTTAACGPSATPESRLVIMPPSARFVMCHFPEGLSDGRPLFLQPVGKYPDWTQ